MGNVVNSQECSSTEYSSIVQTNPAGNYREVGPLEQSIFLGCSVTNFNMNLAWGEDSSSLTVNIVEDKAYHPRSVKYNSLNTVVKQVNNQPVTVKSQALVIDSSENFATDNTKNLVKPVSLQIEEQNINNMDPGKICKNVNGIPKRWLGPDPGFLAGANKFSNVGYDLIGVPAVFWFQDLYFGGLITSWKATGSQGGSPTYEIEMKSGSSLLKGCWLIIDEYAGTVAATIPNTSDNSTGKNISVPCHYDSNQPFLPFNASIRQGNLPNVFNIYGYWEQIGFGNSGRTDNGIPARNIYDALVNMLAPGTTDTNPFFPHGAILGRATSFANGSPVDFTQSGINDADGNNISLKECGLCPNVMGGDGSFHSYYKLDLSALPYPPSSLYMTGPTISLMSFITEICDGSGFDFFISLEPAPDGSNCSGVFKVNTVSRRLQPQKDVIKNYVSWLVNQKLNVSTFNYGQEYSDQTTRSMYLGGKQKRLWQFKTSSLVSKQTTLIYDPYANNRTGSFVNYETSVGQPGSNQLRAPSFLSTRRYSSLYGDGAAVAENQPGNFSDVQMFSNTPNPLDPWSSSNNISRGNYYDGVNLSGKTTLIKLPGAKENHPLYNDVICPYFGVGSNGLVRKVYFDPGMAQMQILFYIDDLKGALPKTYFDGYTNHSSLFLVLENEIRAAGKGFDIWMAYAFNPYFTTDIAELCYKVFRQTYGNFNASEKFQGLIKVIQGYAGGDRITRANIAAGRARGGQASMEDATAFQKTLYNHLQAIHKFFANIATEYYGKQYMVKVPMPQWYRDSRLFTNDGATTQIKDSDGNNTGIFIQQGTGKIYTDFEISSDGAWEEPGNYIDDALIVGSVTVNAMCDDQGKIPPIVGFSNHPEINSREKWVAEQYIFNASQVPASNYGRSHLVTNWAFLLNSRNATDAAEESNNYYSSINHSLPEDEYFDVYTGGFANSMAFRTAHGFPIGSSTKASSKVSKQISKTYVKANCEKDFVFVEPQAEARVVIQISSPVKMGNGRNKADKEVGHIVYQDFLLKMLKDSTIPSPVRNGADVGTNSTVNGGLRRYPYTLTWDPRNVMASFLYPGLQNEIFLDTNGQDSNPSADNMHILEKAAYPYFAAIPLESSMATYGPWTNHPGLIEEQIFDSRVLDVPSSVNNLVGSVKVQHDAGLVPWNYGGMDALDAAVMARIKDDVNYQQITEQGSIQVPGALLTSLQGTAFNLGSALIGENQTFGGPIVSSIQVQVGEGGITTNYNFRTYTRKLGFYNKENSDRIKEIGQESLKRRKEISTSLMGVLSTLNNGPQYGSTINNHPANLWDIPRNQDNTPKVLRWSPFEILAGSNATIVPPDSTITDIYKDLNYSPGWSKMPFTTRTVSYDPINMIRESTNVSLQDVQELPREFEKGYENKSMMSLDGILSPISFYPTPHGSTFSITKYPRPGCPFCQGTAKYKYKYLDPDNPLTTVNVSTITNAAIEKEVDCPFCETIEDKTKKALISTSPKETNPPYILASGDDLTLISRNSSGLPNGLSGNPIINYGTLNPVLMSVGEFSSFPNRQLTDKTGHSIDLIGQGLSLPEGYDGLKPAYSKNIERSFLNYDVNYMEFCSKRGIAPGIIPANNMRYFGLRGPLMVHAWGYDLEGYPVPNASGEPKVINGEIVKDQKTKQIIYKNQNQKPDGTWTAPYKEHQFYKGWGQLPSTWPVGPVDLRWDSNAGVWTVGANYKPIWVVLETDLVNRQPSRGAVIEDSYTNDPLPSGLRKLVFVQDNLNIVCVPRGAPVYCKYNGQNGFYEPIYNKHYMTSGTIKGDTEVSIYQIYQDTTAIAANTTTASSPVSIPTPTTYRTTYNNPMGFNVTAGDLGMFVFIDGSWVLQSVNC